MKTRKFSINRKTLTVAIVATSLGTVGVHQAASSTGQPMKSSNQSTETNLKLDTSSSSDVSTSGGTLLNGVSGQSTSVSQTSPTTGGADSSAVSVTVNGQNIPVPANGSSQQTITGPAGSTSVSVSHDSSSSSGTSTNTSVTTTSESVTGGAGSGNADFFVEPLDFFFFDNGP